MDKIGDDNRVENFVLGARAYCKLVEARASISNRRFIHQCAELLPDLYVRAIRLLNVEIAILDPSNSERLSRSEWQALFNSIGEKLGQDDHYQIVFDPYVSEPPVGTSLSDCLADIYRDLREGLDGFGEQEEQNRKAVGNWRFSFLTHWGRHCVSAMRAIHRLLERYHEDD